MFLTVPDWYQQAACDTYEHQPDTPHPFFDYDETPIRAEYEYCATCPVALDCLHAGAHEPGIWGGMKPDQRHTFLTRHPKSAAKFRRHQQDLQKRSKGYFAVKAWDERNARS